MILFFIVNSSTDFVAPLLGFFYFTNHWSYQEFAIAARTSESSPGRFSIANLILCRLEALSQ